MLFELAPTASKDVLSCHFPTTKNGAASLSNGFQKAKTLVVMHHDVWVRHGDPNQGEKSAAMPLQLDWSQVGQGKRYLVIR